jgi:hypothetical protein
MSITLLSTPGYSTSELATQCTVERELLLLIAWLHSSCDCKTVLYHFKIQNLKYGFYGM